MKNKLITAFMILFVGSVVATSLIAYSSKDECRGVITPLAVDTKDCQNVKMDIYRMHRDYREAIQRHVFYPDSVLELVAELKVAEMMNDKGNTIYWSHENPYDDKIHTWDYMDSFGDYVHKGENISIDNSPEQAMEQWLASPTHLANIENDNYNRIGVYVDCRRNLAVVIFGSDPVLRN